ncbi:MAG: hypothetical protein C4K48_08165 [Candidatus Thorarchaeota archaeon]|nr:MAG: hypothetical protein C4K48_08165 [Candidatus Thorarchaeota archaeon]
MPRTYVVDAGALFSTWTKRVGEGVFSTTTDVVDEIRNRPSKFRADLLEVLDRLREEAPPTDSINAARRAATETGDDSILSETDIELIALAHSKRQDGSSIVLVSTDLAVLNTARHMGIETVDPSGKFKDDIKWVSICPACGHRSVASKAGLECPVCGTPMRRRVFKKGRK